MSDLFRENITGEEIKELDLKWFEGEIVVVDTFKVFRKIIPQLMNSEILGFDTETRPSFKKGRKNRVSLIQLANSKIACLFSQPPERPRHWRTMRARAPPLLDLAAEFLQLGGKSDRGGQFL